MIKLLLAFLRLRVDDPPADPAPSDPPADPQPELDLDPADPDPAPEADPKAELETARREAREAKESAERYQRELAEARAQHLPPVQNDEWAREEAILKDPNATPQDKWKVQADRTLRSTTQGAQLTLAQAHDIADQTAFRSLAMSNPIAKKYEKQVEEKLTETRKRGGNARREDILRYLLGNDMIEGKFKKKAAPAKEPSSSSVNRGKLPGARSDVSARQQKNEREARIERLRNQQI